MTGTAAWHRKHIATRWMLGPFSGKRVGTHYIYNMDDARNERHLPGFRWRNDECRRAFLTATKPTGAA